MFRRRRPAKVIKPVVRSIFTSRPFPTTADGPDFKPLVRIRMDFVVFVAELTGGDAFLQRLCLGGGAVLVCSTDIQRPSVPRP